MAHLSQVDAHLYKVREYLALAQRESANWPYRGILLTRALEYATCAVFIAWGEPRTPEPKMHPFFEERLASKIDPTVAVVVQLVWEREGQGPPDGGVQPLLEGCHMVVEYFAGLATNPPPADWEPLPTPEPVGWGGLAEGQRQFLRQALAAAQTMAPGVQLMLFGSRAAGTARPDSDYDLSFIFPNQIEEWQRGQARGAASSVDRSIKLNIESVSVEEWNKPPAHRPVIDRVKATGIEVPPPQLGTS
jgi:Nucleotidyltransferase domain